MLNDDLFGQTYDQIQKKVFGQGSQYFQMIVAPIPFSFRTPGPGQMDPATYQMLSMMPVWSPLDTFGQNGTTLFSAYRQLLANVTFKVDPGKQADIDRQADQINDYQRQLTQAQIDMNQAYLVAKNNGGETFEAQYPTVNDWLEGPGKTWKGKIDGLTRSLGELNDKYANDLAAMQGDQSLKESLDACRKPDAKPSSGESKAGWVVVADSGGALQWQPEFILSKSPSDVRKDLARGSFGGFSVQLSSSTHSASMRESWAGADASYRRPFFAVNVGGSWDQLDIADSEKSVEVNISTVSSMTDSVTPGAWYDGGFLKDLALNCGAGYRLADGWSAVGPESAAFGQHGLVSTMVASLVLAYKPSVTVSMAESTFKRNKQKIEANAGVRIGPFTFGGEGGHKSDYQLKSNGKTEYTVTSTSEDPLIIGISVGFPGTEKP